MTRSLRLPQAFLKSKPSSSLGPNLVPTPAAVIRLLSVLRTIEQPHSLHFDLTSAGGSAPPRKIFTSELQDGHSPQRISGFCRSRKLMIWLLVATPRVRPRAKSGMNSSVRTAPHSYCGTNSKSRKSPIAHTMAVQAMVGRAASALSMKATWASSFTRLSLVTVSVSWSAFVPAFWTVTPIFFSSSFIASNSCGFSISTPLL
mmetsp:Transcript_51507/g.151837  ORF Transcript_51507/g.151837 Transcript_51507/m.151837 type:complete len:202 (+) Transcript_51507:315-920(+)